MKVKKYVENIHHGAYENIVFGVNHGTYGNRVFVVVPISVLHWNPYSYVTFMILIFKVIS